MSTVDVSSYPNAGTLHRERMRFERDFTQLPNKWLRDKRLSFRARGLLAHLMTHEVGRDVSLPTLVSSTYSEGRDAIRSAIHELEANGYLHRVKVRRKGRFATDAWVLQDPFEVRAVPPTLEGLEPVDNSASPRRISSNWKSDDGGFPVTGNPTTIEDQLRTTTDTSVSNEPLDAPVDNFGAVRWSDDRCYGNYRGHDHELGPHGACRFCHERPLIRSMP